MALNKVKIKNTESIRLVTGDKTEISGGSSFNGIEIVGVTNSADATQVTNKTSLTIHSRVPGISFSVATNGITAEIEAFPVADPDEEEIFNRIAGDNHLYYFTTISGALNIPDASAAGEFIFNADNRKISIHALDLNNRPAGKQSFSAAAEIFNGVILASRTDTAGENVFEEHTITYNNPSYNGTKFDIEDVTITNGTTLENWYGGTRPVLVTVIPDSALLGATEVAARTAFVFPDGCSAQSIVSSWNGLTCEVTFDQYVADINGLTGAIDTSGLTFNFAGVSASGDITTNKLIFADGTSMSTSASGSGGVTSINDVVASFNGLTGAVTLSAGTGITLTGNVLSVDAVTSVNGASGDVTITGATGATGEQAIAKTYAVTVADPGDGNNYYFIDTVQQDTIYLLRGQKYVFSLAGSVSGHPFHLQTTSGSAYDSSNLYTTGVVNAGAESGDITFTVPYDAPSTLYYRCQNHANMGGVVTIKNLTANDLQGVTGDVGATGEQGADGAGGGGATLAAGVGLALSSIVAGVGHTLDVTLSAGTGITLTGTTFNVDAVTSFNGSSGDVTYLISAGTGITLTGTELNVDAVTSFNGSSGDVTLTAGTGITLTGSELNVDAVTSFNGSSGDVTYLISAGTGITLTGSELNVDAVTSFNGSSGDVTLTAGTGITLTGSELNVDAVTSFNGASGDVTLTAGTGITLTGSELNVDAVTSFNGSSGDVTLTAGTGITLTGTELNVDAVTSINGISGAIDTSGLTFNFAGISASGDITAGGRLIADVVQDPDNVNSRFGYVNNPTVWQLYTGNNDVRVTISSGGLQTSNNGRLQADGFVQAGTYVHAGTGVSLDAFGITFADGTYQDTASSGSGGVTSINDVVASLNGLTGAIDTSGVTFDFAGISASGDVTASGDVRSPHFYGIGHETGLDVDTTNTLVLKAANQSAVTASTVKVQVKKLLQANELIHAKAGISMDAAGITFPDGLEQIQASHSFVGAGFDGQGATLQANTVLVPVEQAGSIRSATIVGDVSGSLSVSIFKYGVTSDTADLGASAEVGTISLLEKIIIRDTTEITGTTADIAEGDILAFSLGATAAGAPIIASQKATCKLKIHDK